MPPILIFVSGLRNMLNMEWSKRGSIIWGWETKRIFPLREAITGGCYAVTFPAGCYTKLWLPVQILTKYKLFVWNFTAEQRASKWLVVVQKQEGNNTNKTVWKCTRCCAQSGCGMLREKQSRSLQAAWCFVVSGTDACPWFLREEGAALHARGWDR